MSKYKHDHVVYFNPIPTSQMISPPSATQLLAYDAALQKYCEFVLTFWMPWPMDTQPDTDHNMSGEPHFWLKKLRKQFDIRQVGPDNNGRRLSMLHNQYRNVDKFMDAHRETFEELGHIFDDDGENMSCTQARGHTHQAMHLPHVNSPWKLKKMCTLWRLEYM